MNFIKLACFGLVMVTGLIFHTNQASAQHNHPKMHQEMRGMGFRVGMIDQVASELGVSEDISEKIKSIAYESEKTFIKMRAQRSEAFLELRRLMDIDSPIIKNVMLQVEKIGRLETLLKKSRIQLLLSVRKLLTPEQRKKLRQLMQERRKHRKRHKPFH